MRYYELHCTMCNAHIKLNCNNIISIILESTKFQVKGCTTTFVQKTKDYYVLDSNNLDISGTFCQALLNNTIGFI